MQYEGHWVHGRKSGKGTLYSRMGDAFVGSFLDDEKHGPGRLYLGNGDTFAGDFRRGRKQGLGILLLKSGDAYVGNWINDTRDGLGTFYWATKGTKYVGEWISNQPRSGSVVPYDPRELEEIVTGIHGEQARAVTPSVASKSALPELKLEQPNKIVFDRWVDLRRERAATPDKQAPGDSTLTNRELERLKHSFTAVCGGEEGHYQLLAHQLNEFIAHAGQDPLHPKYAKLIQHLERHCLHIGGLTFERFIAVVSTFRLD
tara:strand:- start:291 stop:1067 length:777 start_codon:yes stop_codon:yes gene_type:complete